MWKISIFCIALILLRTKHVYSSTDDEIDNSEDKKPTIADLVDKAISHYHAEEWRDSINYFEKALVSYKMLQHVEITCGVRCKNANISKELNLDFKDNFDLKYMGDILAKSNCIKLCKEEHPFASTVQYIPPQLQEDLDSKKAYDFLQFAYYNLNAFKKASQAAYTFLQANSENEQAYENVNRYLEMEEINEEDLKDLEEPKFYKLFVEGIMAYEDKDYSGTVTSLEKCLVEYYKSHEECLTLCYKPSFPTFFYRFYKSMTEHYNGSLKCELKCNEKLDPVVMETKIDHFAAHCYSYLQFSYHSLSNPEMAVFSAMSVLLLNPEQENAETNVEYYKQTAEDHNLSLSKHFHPRKDAVKFHSYLNKLEKLIEIGEELLNENDEAEVLEDEQSNDMASLIADLTESISIKLDEKLLNI